MIDQGRWARCFRAWSVTGLCRLLFGTAAGWADSNSPPNILFVSIDDIGWGDLSCYGSPAVDKSGNSFHANP
jgi:hypothetical protein